MNRPGIDWTSGEKEYIDVLIGKFGSAGRLSRQDVLEALDVSDAEVMVISGGNEPEKTKAGLGKKLAVPKNDGLVMTLTMN